MRSALVMLLVACSSPPARKVEKPIATAALHLAKHVWRIGEVVEDERTETTDITQDKTRYEIHKHTRLRSKIMAVDDGHPTKLAVTYEEHLYSMMIDGVEKSARPALTGKTFFVEVAEGEIKVTKEIGDLTEAENAAVLDDHRELKNGLSPFDKTLLGRTWKVGAPFDLPATEFVTFDDGSETKGTMTFTLVDHDDAKASFSLSSKIEKDGSTIASKGEITRDKRDTRFGRSYMKSQLTGASKGFQETELVTRKP